MGLFFRSACGSIILCSALPGACVLGGMTIRLTNGSSALALAGAAILSLSFPAVAPGQSKANIYVQHNLVSDIPGLADVTDPNLVDPWGISVSATSPFWISDAGKSVATLYNVSGR